MCPNPFPAIELIEQALPYALHLQARPMTQIDLVVIHCTELPDLATAREYGERVLYPQVEAGKIEVGEVDAGSGGTGNSGHYYIDRDGTVQQWVRADRIAHHTRGYNPRSLGIELVNSGRYPDWLAAERQAMDEPYTEAQIAALVALLQSLQRELPSLRWIAGHEELDPSEVPASDDPGRRVRRKRDPGPLFPWPRVLASMALERLHP